MAVIKQLICYYTADCFYPPAQLNEELKQNLKETMVQKYKQSGEERITRAVDKLQQEVGQWGTQTGKVICGQWPGQGLSGMALFISHDGLPY